MLPGEPLRGAGLKARVVSAVSIELVRTEAQADEVRALARAFVAWLRERYPDLQAAIDEYLALEDFEGQLRRLRVVFAPPDGECLLARLDGAPVGIVVLKRHGDGVAEMNRLFVRATARRKGVGRALCTRLMERARELGYGAMVLSALDRHEEALPLYRSLGFEPDARAPETVSGASREMPLRRVL